MAASISQPQGHISPGEALALAQQAPSILKANPRAISRSPLVSLFSATETPELWTVYENLLLACLRTGDEKSAHECLERLVARFGGENEKVLALNGLVKEAEADNTEALLAILKEYDDILQGGVSNTPVAKRKVALLKSMDKVADAITALTSILDTNPTDSESWAELSDLYLDQGLYPQAIYALEEALIIFPNAWNMHARLGEVLLMAATTGDAPQKHLAESLKRFCRSIELCDDYLRGYYGLKKVTDQILSDGTKIKKSDGEGFSLPEQSTVEKLNEAATSKLAEIVRRYNASEKLWQGYNADEVAAARQLLRETWPDLIR